MGRTTPIEVIQQLCENKGVVFVDVTQGSHQRARKIQFTCPKHERFGVQEITLDHLKNNKQPCQYCNHSKLKEIFDEEIASINPDIELLSVYVNWNTRIHCRCKIDGHEWWSAPSVLLSGGGCPVCGYRKNWDTRGRRTTQEFIDIMKEINSNIEIIGEYKGAHRFIKCRCRIDGCEWESYPCNLMNQTAGCPECNAKNKRSLFAYTAEYLQEQADRHHIDIRITGQYVNSHTPIECYCNIHRIYYTTCPVTILSKHRNGCPECSKATSAGEREMLRVLREEFEMNIVQQHSFANCKDKSALRFDAYDIDQNIAFEYQGGQHYTPVDWAGQGVDWAQANFLEIQRRDQIKRDYCHEHQIPLIEVPYWETNNMKDFLTKELSKIRNT